MLNKEHYALLRKGVTVWNMWRANNLNIIPELSGADFTATDIREADLRGADLTWANLHRSHLFRANLSGANLSGANLSGTNFYGTNLSGANLSGANLTGTKFYWANLTRANLREANLSNLNLSTTKLNEADISEANLYRTLALGTDFTGAKFTGTCLEDWNISFATKLNDIDCQYVYLKRGKQERYPSSGKFAPGEFTKLFQNRLETFDLIFADGIDWKAFLLCFQELQAEYGEENLSVQAIEKNKSGGAFVIRLEIRPEANKAEIELQAKKFYENQLNLLEARSHAELNANFENVINILGVLLKV
ncbi:MAG: pentapeptide repeat-containing protein [Stigonema ocellatum SAG 48.90 = DSM 106950]|nr:pentapeptide repeat-containing protein [Stigonema ocellatum SAG 48.90 = DSM 106950]